MPIHRQREQEEVLTLQLPQAEAFAAVLAAYKKVGSVQSSQEAFGRIVGKVGSGHANMNRAEVTVRVEAIDGESSRLVFNSAAREGLISQNSAPKAITRILDAIELP